MPLKKLGLDSECYKDCCEFSSLCLMRGYLVGVVFLSFFLSLISINLVTFIMFDEHYL